MTPQDLKNSILQLAIQGKLVEQRPEEGTAEELYELIQTEKARLIKEGKIKKEKPLEPIKEEDIPFDIPQSWKWCRLREVVYNRGQMVPSSKFSYIDIGSIDNKRQCLSNEENLIEADKAPSRARKIVENGDIIYSTVRPYLHNMAIIDRDFSCPPIASTGFATMVCYEGVYNKFLFNYLLSPSFDNYANATDNSKGVAYPAINDEKLYKAIVPLPPLEEQKRIVAKIEELLPLVEKYGKAYERLEEFNKKFPGDMKKSVLQMAIQGKLVEQRPEEGTAEELFAQIQTEKAILIKEGKIKEEKPLTAITDDEKPFDIPDSWKWVRLNSVISLLSGQDLQPTDYNSNSNGIPYLTGASNIEDGQVIINRWTDKPKAIARRGNLLLTCKGTVGKMSILEHTEVHIARQIMAITNVVVDVKYVQYFIETQIGFLKSLAKSMIPGIERDNVLSLCFPLPPLKEQKRIVAKLEEVLPLCDALKK